MCKWVVISSLMLSSGAALAADDAATVLARAQSAWLRGASAELSQLATSNARWATSTNANELHSHAFVQFRMLQLAVARKDGDGAGKSGQACVDSAGKAAAAARAGAVAAESWALQSACYGYLAGVGGTFAAIRNGRASGKSMEQALAADARNSRVILVDAFGLYFRPRIAGGDKAKACTRFREAGASFDRAAGSPNSGWGHAEAHYWIGRCLSDSKDAVGARREFEAALKLAPEFAAAQRALKPQP